MLGCKFKIYKIADTSRQNIKNYLVFIVSIWIINNYHGLSS